MALDKFSTSPITGIHLWFDRQISELDHAVLLDRTIQWMFHKSRLINAREKAAKREVLRSAQDDNSRNDDNSRKNEGGSYVELVVSCSGAR